MQIFFTLCTFVNVTLLLFYYNILASPLFNMYFHVSLLWMKGVSDHNALIHTYFSSSLSTSNSNMYVLIEFLYLLVYIYFVSNTCIFTIIFYFSLYSSTTLTFTSFCQERKAVLCRDHLIVIIYSNLLTTHSIIIMHNVSILYIILYIIS